ncbi:phospholipase A2 [Blastococcus sp. TF02A_35]|uniref:phospholipase A2 n=1 Tax=Blastococcus sp. TF02A-35 TaxID=2559612 RepID=UPI001073843A|nr:phospholipase A2 [Blastococcus sp. TF02A_35]TFV52984.1 hypothetical protein E4P43_03580 [Blastococcus sp. TF02A_35]
MPRSAVRTGAHLRPILLLTLLFVVLATALAAPAKAEDPAPAVDPAGVTIDQGVGTQTYRFPVLLPAGASLQPADPAEPADAVTGEVLVVDAADAVVGAYDSPVAVDASGALLQTSYAIEGSVLVQSVTFTDTTVFPVVVDPAYTKAGLVATTPPPPSEGIATSAYVGVPSNYVYNPRRGSLHDYCTRSPDEFPGIGKNASFKGPCARHDLCYGGGRTSKFTCDNRLRTDMRSNCAYTYGVWNPQRAACYRTADIYWAAVVIHN